MKVYSAVKLPEHIINLLNENKHDLMMHDELTTPSQEDMLNHIQDVDAIISGVNTPINAELIKSSPKLKIISNVGAGYNHISLDTANEHNIVVTNSPAYESTASTAEHAVLLTLALSRDLKAAEQLTQDNKFEGWQVMGYLGGNQMSGKTVAIIGLGTIGQHIAKILEAFQMNILYVDLEKKDVVYERKTLEEALPIADFVILQMNYTNDNHHMINKDTLQLMNSSAYLINNARGGIVDEEALADALDQKVIKGAALDVHEYEQKINQRLRNRDNVILSPHIGNDTVEARHAMAETAIQQVIKFFNNDALDHQVNK
ncbi:2-hydroxyacid dehydrogenase [Aliicoccus persicus]|uniref:Lactate dehydrogenase n=1 Tax=Aliicoccus persicus TaxID=930138 RepID=A0A662Z5V7_9STAP|nr:NAD(P)-dependent oxidoreductase [Aliicoccus persicus]SEV93972.1 Lactate dehydrogenase [Aliicoccus persicus]